jgi:uncharacterized SAM-dependent methyltransferase
MRLYGISSADVAAAILQASVKGTEERGNVRLTGTDLGGRAIIVVIADDDPNFVITTFPDD